MKKQPSSEQKSKQAASASSMRLALESRLLFDGAVVATAAQAMDDKAAQDQPQPTHDDQADTAPDFAVGATDSQTGAPGFFIDNDDHSQQTQAVMSAASFGQHNAPSLLIVDPRAEGVHELIAHPPADTQVEILDTETDGYQQISQILHDRNSTTDIHIQTAEANGREWLGASQVNATLNPAQRDAVINWGDKLGTAARITMHSDGEPSGSDLAWANQVQALSGGQISWTETSLCDENRPDNTNPVSSELDEGQSQANTFSPEQAEGQTNNTDGTDNTIPAAVATVETNTTTSLVFIDTSVADYQTLLQGIDPNATVILLDSTKDGVEQIAQAVAQYDDISAIHIISHGEAGLLHLGTANLNQASIQGIYADELALIGQHLTSTADILIYGCNFGQGELGLQATNALANLTGADIADSTNNTGAASLGGDWVLERQVGQIDTNVVVNTTAQTEFNDLLAPVPTSLVFGTAVPASTNNAILATIGNSWRYSGVAAGIDAIVTISGKTGNPTLVNIDAPASGGGRDSAFQPVISSRPSLNETIQFTFTFVLAGTSTPTTVSNIIATGVDVDGDPNAREYASWVGADSTRLEGSGTPIITQLTAAPNPSFQGINTSLPGISLETTNASYSVFYGGQLSSLTFSLGSIGTQTAVFANRQNSVSFDTTDIRAYDVPVAVPDLATTNEDAPVTFSITDNDWGGEQGAQGGRVQTPLDLATVDLDPTAAGRQTTLAVAGGTYEYNGNGTVTFTPVANFNGDVTPIKYTVANQVVAGNPVAEISNQSTIRVTVSSVNDAPVAIPHTYNMNEDGPAITLTPLSGATDPDGTTPTLRSINGTLLTGGAQTIPAAFGTISISATGVITYLPNPNANGTETFAYVITDGTLTATANETIVVAALNDAPTVSIPGTYTGTEDSTVILNNMTFADVDAGNSSVRVTITVASGVLNMASNPGVSIISGNGTSSIVLGGQRSSIQGAINSNNLTYSPASDFNNTGGTVALSVTFNDQGFSGSGGALSTTANSTISLTPVIDITPDSYTGTEDIPLVFNPILGGTISGGTGGSPDSFEGTPQITAINGVAIPPGGVVMTGGVLSLGTNNVLTFTPNPGFNGIVPPFTYTVTSGGVTEISTININFLSRNDAPSGTDAENSTLIEDTVYTFEAADFGFSDPNDVPANSLLAVLITTLPNPADGVLMLGTVAVNAGDIIPVAQIPNLTFIPTADRNGPNLGLFTFQLQDDGGVLNGGIDLESSPNNFSFNISAVDDITPDTANTLVNQPVTIPVLANDTFEGSPVISAVTNGTNGTVVIGPISGNPVYIPNANFTGTDTFTYTVTSGGVTEQTTVTVTVSAPDPTVSTVGAGSATEGGNLTQTVTLTGATPQPMTLPFVLAGNTATAGTDFTATAPTFTNGVTYDPVTGLITIPAGVTAFDVIYPTTVDALDEGSETTTLTVGGVSGAGTINDPADPTVSTVGAGSATEGGNLTQTVTLTGATPQPMTLPFVLAGNTATAGTDFTATAPTFTNGVTYDPVTGLITIPAGVTAFDVIYPTTVDALDEGSETTTLTVGGVSGAGTINDPADPTVSTVGAGSATEGGNLTQTVTLTGATPQPMTLPFVLAGNTATAGTDFTATAPTFTNGVTYDPVTGLITIPAGVTAFDVIYPTTVDALDEGSETTTLTVGGVSGAGTINDPADPTVSTVGAGSATEGGNLTQTVTLTGATPQPMTLPFVLAGNTATAGTDFTATAPTFTNGVTYDPVTGLITIPAGVTAFDVIYPTTVDALDEGSETTTLTVGGVSGAGTINDPADPTVSTVGAGSATEGGNLTQTVTLTGATPQPMTLPFVLAGNTATAGTDFTATAPTFTNGVTYDPVTGLITIPAGVTAFDVIYPTTVDALDEGSETTTLTVGGVSGAGTINDPADPTVSTVGAGSATEGGNLTQTVTLTGATPQPMTLPFVLAGNTATAGTDFTATAPTFTNGVTYDPVTGLITIPAGVTAFDVIYPTTVDALDEGSETTTLTVGGVSGAGTINDPADPTVSTVGAGSATEGGNLTQTVTLTGATPQPMTLPFVLAGNTATAGTDFTATAPTFTNGVTYDPVTGLITIPAGVTAFDVIYPTTVDALDEGSETTTLTVGGVSGAGTINDPADPTVSTVGAGSATEGGNLTQTVTLTGATPQPMTLPFVLAGNTATAGTDFTATAPTFTNGVTYDPVTGLITIPAGVTAFDVIYPTTVDALDEGSETTTLTVGGVSGAGTINDPADPTVSTVGAGSATEGGNLTQTVTLTGATPQPMTLPFVLAGNTATAGTDFTATAPTFTNGVTYDPVTGLITIPAGVTAFDVIYPTTVDALDEGSETTTLTVGGVSGAGTINDPADPTVSTVGAGSATEGGNLTQTVTLTGATPQPMTLPFVLAGNTATAGTDFTATAPTFTNGVTYDPVTGLITIPAGVTAFDVIYPTTVDALDEGSETTTLTVGGVSGAGTINDPADPTVSTVGAGSATEGGNLTQTVTLTGATPQPMTLPFVLAGNTATAGTDFTATAPTFTNGVTYDPVTGLITIPAGVTAFDVIYPTTVDALDEGSETTTLTVGGVSGAGTINDPADPTVSTVGAGSATEGGNLTQTVTLTGATPQPMTLPFVLAGNTATAGTDFTATAPTFTNGVTYDPVTGLITIPAGVTAFDVIYPTTVDALDEGSETTTLTVGGVSGAGTINDPADPTVSTVGAGSATEGGNLTQTVTLTGATPQPMTLPFVLAGNTATAGTDFTATAPTFTNGVTYDPVTGLITIPAGVTAFDVIYPTTVDALDEGSETTTLTVGGVSGAGTINDPADPTVSTVGAGSATEGGNLTQTVTLTGATPQPMTLPFVLAGNTATAGTDFTATAPTFTNGVTYDPVTGLITIPAGVTAFDVIYPTTVDALDEGSETTTLTVGGVSGAGTINDPADPTVSTVGAGSATEGGNLTQTVTLTGATPQPMTLPFVLAGNTATAGTDFTATAPTFTNGVTYDPVTGLITIPAGVTAFDVIYPTTVDALDEGSETTTLTVGGVSGAGTINDPADPTVSTVGAGSATEGGNLTQTVTLTGATPQPMTLPFVLAGNTATAGTDFTATAPTFTNGVTYDPVTGLITIPAGVTAFDVIYPTTVDALDEGSETTTLTVGGVSGAGTINDPADPTVSTVGAGSATEGGNLTQTVTLTGATPQPMTLPFVLAGNTATAGTDFTATAPTFTNGVTYDPVTGLITIPAGVTAFDVIYPTTVDALDEGSETTTLTVGGVSGAGTINDPADPTVSTVGAGSATEGGNLTQTVTLTGATPQPMTLPFVLAGNTATAGTDFTATAPTFTNGVTYDPVTGLITIPAGVTAFDVIYPTTVDALDEGSETTTLTVGGVSGAGTINDPADPTVSTVGAGSATEGGNLTQTVTLTGATPQPMTLPFVLAGNTATAGTDFTATAPTFTNGVTYDPVTGLITIPAGVTAFDVIYPTTVDALDEGSETTTLTVGGVSGAGTINDPADPTVSTVGAGSATEGGNLTQTVTLTGATPQPMTLPFVLAGNTATAGTDFTATAPTFTNGVTYDPVTGLITIPAGVTAFDVIYPTTVDALDEGSETTTLTVGGVSGAGTINDPADPTVSTVGAGSATEGGNLTQTVTLTGATPQPMTLPFVLAGNTATAGTDFTATAPTFTNGVTYDPVTGLITIPAGVTAFDVIYPTTVDALDEGSETTTLTVGGVSGAGTINDPADPTVSTVGAGSATEGGNLTQTVTLTGATPQPMTLPFVLAGNTATAGTDFTATAPTFTNGVTYDPVTGLITIPAGVTAFDVIYPTTVDALDEGSETTTLTVGGVSGAGTINDPVKPPTSGNPPTPKPPKDDFVENGSHIMLSNPTPQLFPPNGNSPYFREPGYGVNVFEPNSPIARTYGALQDYDVYLTGYLNNRHVKVLTKNSFSIPYGTFRHSNPNERLEYQATLADGSPLPIWLDFDPKRLQFTGIPPRGEHNFEVLVTAKDSVNKKASATFKVIILQEDRGEDGHENNSYLNQPNYMNSDIRVASMEAKDIIASKSGFSEQLSMAGKMSRLAESRALLNSIEQL